MNTKMVRILIRKDMQLLMKPVLFYFAAGLVAVGLTAIERQGAFYAGAVLLITSLMGLGFHPAMATIVGERREQTLAFVMSMPVTPTDVTCAKLLANLLMFFVPWTVLLLACTALIAARPALPDGLIPYVTILFGTVGASAVMILCVALLGESMHWTIATQIASNLAFQGVMYAASNNPVIGASMQGKSVVWSTPALAFDGAFLGLALVALALTVWLQSRKTDFI